MKPKIKETKKMKDLAQSSKWVVNYMIDYANTGKQLEIVKEDEGTFSSVCAQVLTF